MPDKKTREYYTKKAGYEWKRLVKDEFHKLELNTTLKFLEKYLPKRGLILDAGGGPGRYTIELARRGCNMVLLDYTPENLKIAKRQIKKAKVEKRVKAIVEGTITDLSEFASNSFDAVICLGAPLSHVTNKKERRKAIAELIRVAKKNAPIFVSVVGTLSLCINSVTRSWPEVTKAPNVYRRYCLTGDYAGGWGFTAVHSYRAEELKKEFEKKARVLEMVGLEGMFSPYPNQAKKFAKNKKYFKMLLEIHNKICTIPSIVDISQHFMIICKKI